MYAPLDYDEFPSEKSHKILNDIQLQEQVGRIRSRDHDSSRRIRAESRHETCRDLITDLASLDVGTSSRTGRARMRPSAPRMLRDSPEMPRNRRFSDDESADRLSRDSVHNPYPPASYDGSYRPPPVLLNRNDGFDSEVP